MNRFFLTYLLVFIPVGIFAQNYAADTTGRKIFTWKLTDHFSRTDTATLDTNLLFFQIYNPIYKKDVFPMYLGNMGSAGQSTYFFFRQKTDFFFLQNFQPYITLPENQIYMNTKSPFSDFTYTTGGGRAKSEQSLHFVHTQNISPDFNAGLKLNVYSSEGQYSYQKCADNSFYFFTSYTKDRYKIYGHAGMNNISQDENGGIENKSDLEGALTEEVATQLNASNNAQTRMKNRNIMLVQQISVGKFKFSKSTDTLKTSSVKSKEVSQDWARIIHVFKYGQNFKKYSDDEPLSEFYFNTWIDSLKTNDSVYFRQIFNSLALDFQSNPLRKFRMALNAGVINELNRYSYNLPVREIINREPVDVVHTAGLDMYVFRNDTSYIDRKNENITNTAVRGEIINDLGDKAGWKASGRFYFQGYKAGNLLLNGEIYKIFNTRKSPSKISILGLIRNERPQYWYNHYASNNLKWDNNFSFENETRILAEYKHPGRSLFLNGGIALLGNRVYFDSLARPIQAKDPFPVFSIFIRKDFLLWKIRFRNFLSVQQSGNETALPLPLVSFRNSTYFDHNFYFPWTKGNLYVQMGFDLYYHTPYYAPAYMPTSARFYYQHKQKAGNYPFLDVFLNMKVKRTRIFLKYEHVTSGFMGYDFFTIPDYPMNQRVFKAGFSWTFYD